MVVVYLVLGSCRVPWSLRLWQGAGTASPVQFALEQLRQLPLLLRQSQRLMVLADGGFGTIDFLQGVEALGMPAVVTLRADRQLEGGSQLCEIRGCEAVRPTGLGFTVWATWLRLKGTDGRPGVWRHVASTKPLSSKMIKRWGRRRFAIEGFFKVIKHRFGLHCFGQCTRLGVYRWFMFSLLAYTLAYQAHLDAQGDELPDWQTASQQALRLFLPDYLMTLVLHQVEKLATLGRSFGFEVQLCNCKI